MARTAIDWAIARRWLAALTEDVRTPPTASPDALLAARKDIAIALMDGQVDGPSTFEHPFIYTAASVSLPPSRWAIYDAARPTGSPTPGQRVVRRTPALPFNAIQQDTFPENKMSGQKATLTHGPFLDRMNREVYIDVFRPSPFRSFEFFINGIFIPHLYTTSPVESGGSFVADLGRGTVWIRADLFTRSSPVGQQATESTYFGLAIESGTLTLPPITTGQRSLNLNLAGTATDSPIFSIAPITTVSFLFTVDENNIVSATITSLGNGATTVLGSKFNMRPSEFNASYDGLAGRMNFAMTADNSTFAPAMQSSHLVDSSGTSTVVAAAWSIPAKDVDGITFYEVATAGGFSLSMSGGTVVGFRGDNQAVSLQEYNIFVDSGSLIITGSRGQMPVRSRTVIIGEAAANATTPKSSVTFRPQQLTRYCYRALASGSESWTIVANMTVALDQPRTVNNERVQIRCQNGGDDPWSTLTWYHDAVAMDTSLHIRANNTISPEETVAFAMKNLLLKADLPATVEIAGKYNVGVIESGALATVSILRYTLAMLPDPYASNFEFVPDPAVEKNGMGYLTISRGWSQRTMDEMTIDLMSQLALPAKTMERNQGNAIDDSVLGRIRDGTADFWEDGTFFLQEIQAGVMPDIGIGQLFHAPNGNIGSERFQVFHPPTLLDLSSSSSQFGVAFSTGLNEGESGLAAEVPSTSFAAVEEFGVSHLMMESAASNVRLMALPAVQWEPVLEESLPHDLYTYPYSGPSTQIAIQDGTTPAPSMRLIPVAPQESLHGLIESFDSPPTVSIATRTSLPFGMVALAKLNNLQSEGQAPARMEKIEFTLGGDEDPKTKLKSPALQPAHQLRFNPPSPSPPGGPVGLVDSEDASFSGRAKVLKMGVGPLKGAPPSTERADLLDPATTTFNDEMQTKVPLLRFDISGYGASIFSDWKRVLPLPQPPQAPPPPLATAITHVQMNVLTGRTSSEIVEIQAVMGPFAVPCVKAIKIRRMNSGVVFRHEGKWQPVSDGRYFYPNTDIITHPGVIRGVKNVRNIDDVGGTFQVDGVPLELRKVRFDCDVEIEDGGQVRSIPGLQLDGCVFLTGVGANFGKSLSTKPDGALWYTTTLQKLTLGGRIDTIVQIGTSGQQKRLTSITVQPTRDSTSGKLVAAVAAMGVPIFPGGGQWSFVRTRRGDQANQPQPVDLAKGVPLVKVGQHDNPDLGSLVTPYLFRDPQDLLNGTPPTAYNIVHGAASHRVMFANPEIPFAQEARKGFEAAKVWVADSVALGKSASIFPSLDDCLPVKTGDATQLLEIVQGGGYKFEPKRLFKDHLIPHLELDEFERIVKNDASVQTVAQAIQDGTKLKDAGEQLVKDVLDAKTTLSVDINTLTNISKIDVTNLHMVTRTIAGTANAVEATAKDATRVIGRLSSDVKKIGGLLGADPDLHLPTGAELPAIVGEVQHKFGSALSQVQKALSFLENLNFLPHFKVSMTNEWAMVMSTSMNRDDLLEKIPSGTRDAVERIIERFEFLIIATISLSAFLFKMHIGTTIKIPTGVGPIVALGTGAFDVALGTSGVQVGLDLGFGIGVDFSVGPFSASASYTQSQTILVTEVAFGLGISACMRAHVDLVIASADLYLEAKLLVVGGDCKVHQASQHNETTIWAYASIKIALHVSIFLVCNIGVEEEAHWDSNMNGGPCALEQMTDLPL